MDGTIVAIVNDLQSKLGAIDGAKDRDTLVWAHGFLTGLVNSLESRLSNIQSSSTLRQEVRNRLSELDALSGAGNLDGLDRIEREMGEAGIAPVPATRIPGPKGLKGGATAPLPDETRPS